MTLYARTAIVLGLLASLGPLAIDMYLPALPVITADLRTTTAATQMTLTAFFIGYGLSQIVYGPVSDMFGRKLPLYIGLALFIAGSVGSILAPTIEWLILCRCVQGVGAAVGMVVPRAIVRDLHTGVEAARLMGFVMLVISVAPILAPLFGSALIVPFGWRSVFIAVTIAAVVAAVLVALLLPETLARADRIRKNAFTTVLSAYGRLLRDGHFLGLTFIGGFCLSSFFAFLASSAFIYIDHFGLTPTQFSLAFAVNAIGFIGASQLSAPLGARFGMTRMVMLAVMGYAAFGLLSLAVTLAGVDNLWALMAMVFLTFACQGLVIPATMVLALDDHGPIAGMASALGGTLQFAVGASMMVLVGILFDGTALPMVTVMAISSVAALILSRFTLRRRRLAAAPAE